VRSILALASRIAKADALSSLPRQALCIHGSKAVLNFPQAAAGAAAAAAPLPSSPAVFQKRGRPEADGCAASAQAPPAASALACDAGAPLWLYRTKHGVFGPFSLAHLRSQEALFRRVRRFKELRIWRTGASEAADSVLLSAAFGDAAGEGIAQP
jgi:hypothetical protein